jgi:hypothetical protein
MSNRVYTYTKITELKNAYYFSEIAALPQITMSLEMASNMAYDMRVFKNNIMGFYNFQQRLFPEWNTAGQKFTYVTVLNQFLREKIHAANDKMEREWLFGCKKNLYFAIHQILRLEEANVRPEDIKEPDRDLRLFLEMWRKLEQADDRMFQFRRRMAELREPAAFEAVVNQIFRFHGRKQIVWNGFPFFTPIQQFVYDCFQGAGYDIYALIQDDPRYLYANEIWNHLYCPENGFPNPSEWIRQENTGDVHPLGEIFESGQKVKTTGIRILKYKNSIEFIEDIPRIKEEGYYLYCTDDRTANAMLRDYYPERYGVRNLLAYPIGQFVYTLHTMWDESRQCIILTPNALRKCFASGWLTVHGNSSTNYSEDLERLLPYFNSCSTLDEWNERLSIFRESYENAVAVFEDDSSDEYGNPFRKFSAFSMDEKRIADVLRIISQLIRMARTLFGKNEPVFIQEHMSRLDILLQMKEGMPQELYLEEREKVKRIFEALESDKVKNFQCYPGDLATTMVSFMRDSEQMEEEADQKGLQTLVFHLFQVEAAPISSKGKVHICMADSSRLPGAVEKIDWPLDEKLLRRTAKENAQTYLPNWIENNQLIALSNRYYLYAALKNEQVEISWIQKQGEKLYSPSPYITLLEKFSDIPIQESEVQKLDLQRTAEIIAHNRMDRTFQIAQTQGEQILDRELEYALCPMRFVYSYVLGNGSVYRNEYQQNRAIVRLIQVLWRLLKDQYDLEQIAEQVFALFPSIRKAEKRQMLDDAKLWSLPEEMESYTTYCDRDYSDYRLNLLFVDKENYQQAKTNAGKEVIRFDRGNANSKNCMYCPHSGYCRKSLFGVDYREEQA